ncbi:MAG: type I DNA topoisomerase [Patescibacteria group bacterium]
MAKHLVIVESPAKAKTIEKMLGKGYTVQASYGHVRDLPKSKLGVEVEENFAPHYVIPTKVRKNVTKLKELAKKADLLYIATDEDREGEAIGWHIQKVLDMPPEKVRRVAFHEITKEAIDEAFAHPRQIDEHLVDAQQARRILDRLVGYKLSPLLWKKILRRLSAGRVQSVALRILADREREIQGFNPEEYWKIGLNLSKASGPKFDTEVVLDEGRIANQEMADELVDKIKSASVHKIIEVKKEERKRNPSAPFTTSTLQQAASTQLGFSVKKTMLIAQQLYEGIDVDGTGPKGLITYMRTDSTNLAESAVKAARAWIEKEVGKEYLPATANVYRTKKKGAQEAHEAIRPSYPDLTPDQVTGKLGDDHLKLYRLIWQRLMSSQMLPALIDTQEVRVDSNGVISRVNGAKVKFAGYAKVLTKWPFTETELPELNVGDDLTLHNVEASQHFTEPPARYTEAALVKQMEKMGIGRPSTYAPTITTLITRGYVEREKRTLFPQDLGLQVNDFLVEHFPTIVDFDFTAKMEEDLDKIADGETDWVPIIRDFYNPFIYQIEKKDKELKSEKPADVETDEKCPLCESTLLIKAGRFGKFKACSNFPTCKYTASMEEEGGEKPKDDKTGQPCPTCGVGVLTLKRGRFGNFYGCSKYPECKHVENIKNENDIEMKCPKCTEGDVVTKRTKRGKVFWGCNKYPDCDFASWEEPVADKCPTCNGFMNKPAKKGYPVCTECGFEDKDVKA